MTSSSSDRKSSARAAMAELAGEAVVFQFSCLFTALRAGQFVSCSSRTRCSSALVVACADRQAGAADAEAGVVALGCVFISSLAAVVVIVQVLLASCPRRNAARTMARSGPS